MSPQTIVWDDAKAALNWRKHGVSFEEAATVFRDPLLLTTADPAHSQDEQRWIALGRSFRQILLVVVHVEDERVLRIISARRATPRRQYEQQS